jgi:hypothetical protein
MGLNAAQNGRIRVRTVRSPANNQERARKMKSKFQQISKIAVPAVLVAMMTGCVSTSDIEDLQSQIISVRGMADSANTTANSAYSLAQEAKAAAGDARNAANSAAATANSAVATANTAAAKAASAEKASTEASGYASAAVKTTETAVGLATQAQKAVGEATVAIPWMRLDPATGQFTVQWIIWPSVGEYLPAQPAQAAVPPAANGN